MEIVEKKTTKTPKNKRKIRKKGPGKNPSQAPLYSAGETWVHRFFGQKIFKRLKTLPTPFLGGSHPLSIGLPPQEIEFWTPLLKWGNVTLLNSTNFEGDFVLNDLTDPNKTNGGVFFRGPDPDFLKALCATRFFSLISPPPLTQDIPEKLGGFFRWFDQKIVFTNGCFDLFHPGHLWSLKKASEQGDVLIVGLNSDLSVRSLKGDSRPLISQEHRAAILSSLSFVSYTVIFDDPTPLRLIEGLKPDVVAKGEDYQIEDIVGARETLKRGGKVYRIPLFKGFSTTTLVKKIMGSNENNEIK